MKDSEGVLALNNSPIFENEDFKPLGLVIFIKKTLKKYIRYHIFFISIFIVYFFIKSPEYSSEVSFYTNYSDSQKSSSISLLQSFSGLSPGEEGLRFSVADFLASDKFLEQIVEKKYIISGNEISLIEYWGADYNDIFTIHPLNLLKNINRRISLAKYLTEEDEKILFAKEKLARSLVHSEDRRSSLQKIKINLRDSDPYLTEQIANEVVMSIINYSNEVSSVKAKEKKEFVSGRLSDIKNELLIAENELLLFLEKNKKLTSSPNLILQKERIERDINLYASLYISLSDQLELAKIDQNDTTSSIFLLDKADVSPYKSGRPLLMTIVWIFCFVTIFVLILDSFKNRKELFL